MFSAIFSPKFANFVKSSLEFVDFRADFYWSFTKSCRINKNYQIFAENCEISSLYAALAGQLEVV